MIILQRWSKIETLLSGIISDTIVQDDSTELDDLNASRRAAQNLLLGMQQNMTDLVHAEKLRYFADNLLEDYVDINDGNPKHRTLIEWMKAPDAKLINYDKLTVQRRKEGGKFCKIELYGVALKDCFFLLRQDPETGKFAIYRDTNMPPILIWTLHFGYFRDQAGSPLTFIIIMDTNNATPTLDKFECSTYDEVARWQKVFTDGFDNFGKVNEPELETLLQKNTRQLEFAEARRRRQEEKLELISSLTTDIFAQWEVRNIAFRALMIDEGLTTPASRSSSSRSTNRDPFFNRRSITSQSDLQQSEDEQIRVRNLHDRFMKSVMRLASLCGEVDSTGLSRSASDAADRRLSCSSAMPPTPEIAAAYDSLKKKSEKESITLRIKSRSQNRFSNILRTGSRRRADGASVIASPTDFQRDDWTPGMDLSDGASESSLATFSNSNALIADIQELARSLLENYDNQYIHCLEMEKDIIRLKAEVDIAGGQTSINAKRELEYLRSLQKKTECEQKAWNAYKQKEEARLEREDQKLKNLAKDLAEKQHHYEEDRRTLQEQIDLHASRGIEMGRLKAHGSTCSLHFAPQTEVESTSLPLTQSQSLRNETRPLPSRTMQVYTVKVPKGNLPAPVTKELEDRLQKPDLTGPPGTNRPRVASSESLNGLHPGHSPHPRNHEFEYTGGASMNTARPPAGPRTAGDLPKTPGVSATNSTLGDLPAKLATKSQSKSRSVKKLLRH
uniref:PH domain-containing protein n=1 Tax=Mesocestoides corti TaxID=53468 RepID=A0A5K3FAG6_MESCO